MRQNDVMSEPVRVVRADELVAADPTPGMFRQRAFELPLLWAGRVETQPGAVSGWHHHDINETSIYVVSGVLRMEFEGHEGYLDARAGDFVYAPAMHYHHIKPTGSGPSIRLAITPPGEFHRHDRPAGQGPNGR